MKTMTLGKKIGLGFGVLILIAGLLGGMAIWRMSVVRTASTMLALDYMPAATVANNVEREAHRTMYEMRGYAFTEETNYLAKGWQNMAEVKKYLQDAKNLAANAGDDDLVFLKEAAEKAEARALEYEQLSQQTVAVTEGLIKDRAAMDAAAQSYMKECNQYLVNQQTKLEELLHATNAATTSTNLIEVEDRVAKLKVANEIIELGNEVRVGNFKAQATRDPQLFRETLKKLEGLNPKLDALKAVTKQKVNLDQIETCRAAGKAYGEAMDSFLTHWQTREELNRKRLAAGDGVLAEAKNTAVGSMKTSTDTASKAAGSLGLASTVMVVGLITAVLVGVVLGVYLTRSITKPIQRVAGQLSEGAEQTVSAASQVSSSSQSLAEGASEQAASLEETSSSLEEMSSMTKRNTENAERVNELARQARTAADAGAVDMQEMTSAMNNIKTSADDIAKIIKTIDEIAFQTNILALNAAVEAARAGEAGMGFAVVADEVRNLAQRAALAAKETAGKIENAVTKTSQGVEISGKVTKSLQEILARVRQVDELAAEVATASKEQSQGIQQVNLAVTQMDKVTQSNAASAEESASAAEELNAQAESLKQAVGDLLQLVNGQATDQGRAVETKSIKPTKAASGAAPKIASASANGNGRPKAAHRPEAAPLAAVTAKREEVPVTGDFQDF